jgi:hypothetical protein
MNHKSDSHLIKSEVVEQQLDQLEEKEDNESNKKGSTNEIQPMANEEGLTQ